MRANGTRGKDTRSSAEPAGSLPPLGLGNIEVIILV
jgi:hypothetical protein